MPLSQAQTKVRKISGVIGTPDTKVAIAHPPHFDLGQKKKPGERPGLKGEERKKKIHQIMLR